MPICGKQTVGAFSKELALRFLTLMMSTGVAAEEEIAEAVGAARGSGYSDLVLLHCISNYPAPMDQANIRNFAGLGRRFDVVLG